jgi:sulfite reductase alpha subunit-like flavoprotein
MSQASLPEDELAKTIAFESGRAAGLSTVAEMRRLESPDASSQSWLAGFLRGAIDAAVQHPGRAERVTAGVPRSEITPEPARGLPGHIRYPARISDIETHGIDGVHGWLSAALEADVRQLEYLPGSSLAIWPTNDAEEVRRVLKALRVNAQLQVPTEQGMRPAWQVLLERVDIGALRNGTIRLLANYARVRSEASSLAELAKLPPGKPRSLLGLFRRYPSCRPPLEHLLPSLGPLTPSFVPIASSCLEHTKPLLVAMRSAPAGSGWGNVSPAICSKLQLGQWLSVSIDERQFPPSLSADDLEPVIIVADGPYLAAARSFAAQRRERQAAGRTWIIATGVGSSQFPFARALSAWHRSGSLSRFDVALGFDATGALSALEELDENLWRWLMDRSRVFLISPRQDLRIAMTHWLASLIGRRQRLDRVAALQRLHELAQQGEWMTLPSVA